MKNIRRAWPVFGILILSCQNQPHALFDANFINETLRIDYYHSGDAENEDIEIDGIYRYDDWAGGLVHLNDSFGNGAYFYHLYDKETGELIYSKGFDSYFKEYQTTSVAIEGQVKQFHESAILPMPNSSVIFSLRKRDRSGILNEVFSTEIDPALAIKSTSDPGIKIFTTADHGDMHKTIDIAIIGEGYTSEEEEKFVNDLNRFTRIFFSYEPMKTYQQNFNIRGVLKYSEESGVDEPRAGIEKSTAINASFNSLGSERYLLTEDNRSLRDVAGHVPYDAIYVMVNHARYGGGGIYNFYCVFTSDNINSEYLMIHEFGHSFFGLADEYYTSSTAYNDFYPAGIEPVEPNITALIDPENLKWKDLLTPGIEIPTPWEKTLYDSLDMQWQTKRTTMNEDIARLKRENAPEEEIIRLNEAYNKESMIQDSMMTALLDSSRFAGMVGAFEGAGYASKGLYRPTLNCIMFSRVDYFCPVCRDAMIRVINSYCE